MTDKLAQDVVDAWDAVNFMRIGYITEDLMNLRDAINALRKPKPTQYITFDLFVKLPSISNQRGMWAKHSALKKKQRSIAAMHALSSLNVLKPPTGQITVKLTRIIQRGKRLDDDNIRPAFKAIRDGIADAFKIDDGSDRWEWEYEQRKIEDGNANGLTGAVSISW